MCCSHTLLCSSVSCRLCSDLCSPSFWFVNLLFFCGFAPSCFVFLFVLFLFLALHHLTDLDDIIVTHYMYCIWAGSQVRAEVGMVVSWQQHKMAVKPEATVSIISVRPLDSFDQMSMQAETWSLNPNQAVFCAWNIALSNHKSENWIKKTNKSCNIK